MNTLSYPVPLPLLVGSYCNKEQGGRGREGTSIYQKEGGEMKCRIPYRIFFSPTKKRQK